VTCYPDGVREELRRTRTRSRSPKLAKFDMNLPSPRALDHKSGFGSKSPSVYSCGEEITVSSVKEYTIEPPSWFSDHTTKSGRTTVYSYQTSDVTVGGFRDATRQSLDTPSSAKSWETFQIPSIPPSPVDSTTTEFVPVPVPARDPRLPPADYLLYKDMYDEAMIRTNGKLPAEWVAYTHRHFTPGRN
jgi:hypothetical protein